MNKGWTLSLTHFKSRACRSVGDVATVDMSFLPFGCRAAAAWNGIARAPLGWRSNTGSSFGLSSITTTADVVYCLATLGHHAPQPPPPPPWLVHFSSSGQRSRLASPRKYGFRLPQKDDSSYLSVLLPDLVLSLHFGQLWNYSECSFLHSKPSIII